VPDEYVACPAIAGPPTSCDVQGAGNADVVVTVKVTPPLATPFTVTVTGPVVAPFGTAATMLDALQLVGVATVPLKRTVLEPCVAPKFAPLIVTEVPTEPEVGERLAMLGAVDDTVNVAPLLATPFTVTARGPVVAPPGTDATMLDALQLVGVATVPLKRTLLALCVAPKFAPLIVTEVPTAPDAGERLVTLGAVDATVNVAPLLARPPTVTVTGPVVAPPGTDATMLDALQLVGVTTVPLNRTLLVPCVEPKFAPLIVTDVPTEPDAGERLVTLGAGVVDISAVISKDLMLS
jgi:hypothetical protein